MSILPLWLVGPGACFSFHCPWFRAFRSSPKLGNRNQSLLDMSLAQVPLHMSIFSDKPQRGYDSGVENF
ncbi:hypothetical protein PGT21_010794 [Puccinia graminis f. sp. tritici]|uniref:Uncharacterized protein n=1 Tax=Puccinia graminis f. sp. tritici TaxID=56615 RepID=A0A5B0NJ09_PUCGR|nr:hypothetical protein PGT21_010794 [Puccinia graminis f. sp. tritici]